MKELIAKNFLTLSGTYTLLMATLAPYGIDELDSVSGPDDHGH